MGKSMLKWIHQLLNPHCEQCRDEKEDSSICKTCEILKVQLEVSNSEKRLLLAAIIPQPKVETTTNPVNPEAIRGRHIPFNVRRQMLEAEDRREAALIAAKQKEIAEVPKDASIKTTISIPQSQSVEELEKELEIG